MNDLRTEIRHFLVNSDHAACRNEVYETAACLALFGKVGAGVYAVAHLASLAVFHSSVGFLALRLAFGALGTVLLCDFAKVCDNVAHFLSGSPSGMGRRIYAAISTRCFVETVTRDTKLLAACNELLIIGMRPPVLRVVSV
jgi:hypothetical protein